MPRVKTPGLDYTRLRREALDALDEAGRAATVEELMAALGRGRDAVITTLSGLIETGEVARVNLHPPGRPGKQRLAYVAVEEPPRPGPASASTAKGARA